jgi:glycosyltransferase involved in cell wall biosynthesis
MGAPINVAVIGPGHIREGFFGNHVRFFDSSDVKCRLISPGVEYKDEQPVFKGAGLEIYQCRAFKGVPWRWGDFKLLLSTVRWADVVHVYHTAHPFVVLGAIFAALLGKPLFSTTTDHIVFKGGLYALSSRLVFKLANIVTTFSSAEADWVQGVGVPASKVKVIPLAIDTNRFKDMVRIKNELNTEERKGLQLLFVGRKHTDKNLQQLIECFAEYVKECGDSTTTLTLLGREHDKSYSSHLERVVQELGLDERVRLIAEVKEERDFLEIFASADVFIDIALLGSFELVVLEAMTLGIPVIASSAVGVAEVVSEVGSGIVVDPLDKTQIVVALSQMLLEDRVREGYAERCRENSSKYHYTSMTEKLAILYGDLLSSESTALSTNSESAR